MTLEEWMEKEGKTVEDIAYELRACRATVYKWRQKAFKPSNAYMEKIIALTDGQVTREDF